MTQIEWWPADDAGRAVALLEVVDARDWPSALPIDGHYGLLLVWDARAAGARTVARLIRARLLDGLAFLCAWGPGSDRVHDLADEEIVLGRFHGRLPPETDRNVVVTTWHADEALAETMTFFLSDITPAADYRRTCRTRLVGVIGDASVAAEARRLLSGGLG